MRRAPRTHSGRYTIEEVIALLDCYAANDMHVASEMDRIVCDAAPLESVSHATVRRLECLLQAAARPVMLGGRGIDGVSRRPRRAGIAEWARDLAEWSA